MSEERDKKKPKRALDEEGEEIPDLRYTKAKMHGVEISRDLSGSGWLERGSKTRASSIQFRSAGFAGAGTPPTDEAESSTETDDEPPAQAASTPSSPEAPPREDAPSEEPESGAVEEDAPSRRSGLGRLLDRFRK